MNDRELLELAAKAANIQGGWGSKVMIGEDEIDMTEIWFLDDPETCAIWDPLTDDGDALRLAVGLGLFVVVHSTHPGGREKLTSVGHHSFGSVCEYHTEEPFAATRRAIVRAAAAIGRAIQ